MPTEGAPKTPQKRVRIREYISPELAKIIEAEALALKARKETEAKEQELKGSLEDFVQEIVNTETKNENAKKIGEILQLLPGNAHDIILRYHPEYKGLKVDFVQKIIADYLGDFMMAPREFRSRDLEKFRDVLDIKNIREEILYNMKGACLTSVNLARKKDSEADERTLVDAYFNEPDIKKIIESDIPEFKSAIKELREYFDDIFVLRENKPGNIVDSLKEGRIFPDINQLLNIKEMKEKKRMLIADEMGLGKSASVILTKEYLSLKCALVVVPSNVVDTWSEYLSDKVDPETGKQVGYFKKGLQPKVLIVNSPKDMERIHRGEVFDYVVISQERLPGKKYGEALQNYNFDMMIVDEVHKVKKIESGIRSSSILSVANSIKGENKYLTLLSGTPVPNKVSDIAVPLRLLYPEKYAHFTNTEMVKRILYGDAIDLRSELLMRMQMKELATSIEMPEHTHVDIETTLSQEEREIYEILLEEDEMTAAQKIVVFRKFLLNPELLGVEPEFHSSKFEALQKELDTDLQKQDKIVIFVNGYIDGVIHGKGNIVDKLKLPPGTVVERIHGDVSPTERKRIQQELKVKGQKMVVFVSGQTADVGVDFSGADGAYFYNEPWCMSDKRQQNARIYREGLKHDLVTKTFITHSTIEEGIRRYMIAKEKAIQKLLRGIGNTMAEKKLLEKDAKVDTNDVETNAELSKEYMSDWERLMIHFGEGFEAGETAFRRDLDTKGKEYASLYRKLGRLTYQGNNARVTATMIERMMNEQERAGDTRRILDIASGPEMLREAATDDVRDRIFSLDINKEHFVPMESKSKRIIGSYLNLPARDNSLDYCNLAFAYHQTSPINYSRKNFERLQVLAEMNRALRPGGRAIISMLHNIEFPHPESFGKLMLEMGFKVVQDYSGTAYGGENYKTHMITLEKVADIPEYTNNEKRFVPRDIPKDIAELGKKYGRELLEGLEMKKVGSNKSRIKDQRRMIESVHIGGKEIDIIFNDRDKKLFEYEKQSIKDGEVLKEKYGGVAQIPLSDIKAIGFERKLETPGYFLLYKIIKDGGAVIIRDRK